MNSLKANWSSSVILYRHIATKIFVTLIQERNHKSLNETNALGILSVITTSLCSRITISNSKLP